MKLNWGHKIGITYIVFVLLTLTMVGFFMMQDVDLVTPNYYEEEIKYQSKIDKLNRTKDDGAIINYLVEKENLKLQFPKISDENISGEIFLYRPSDMKKDFKLPVQVNPDFSQIINTGKLDKGIWRISVQWNLGQKEYFSESVINLM